MHVEPSHWLHEIFISKTICHHFWLVLMVGALIWGHIIVHGQFQHKLYIFLFCQIFQKKIVMNVENSIKASGQIRTND
jgi:hypothetical protein